MTALARRRRARTTVAFASGLAAAVCLPVLGVAASRTIANSKDGRDVAAAALPTVELPATPTALLAVVDAGGQVTSASVLALRPSGSGGSVVSIPTTANRDVTGETPTPLADAFAAGGAAGVVADVESMLSVSLTVPGVVDEAGAAELLAAVGDVTVTLPAPIVDSAGVELFPVGTSTLTPAEAARLLATDPVGVPDAAHHAAHGALWTAIAENIGDGRDPGAVLDQAVAPADIGDFLRRFFAGRVDRWSLSSIPLTEVSAAEVSALDAGEVLLVMASVAPSAVSAAGDGLSYQIEFGFPNSALVADLIEHLVAAGGNVVSVVGRGDVPEINVLYVAEEHHDSEAAALDELIGSSQVERPQARVAGVDVVVVLGRSFLDRYPSGMPAATTSTVPADE